MGVRVLATIMAGGKGTRLEPLTAYRAKPAVPFAGKYRLIDFVLSNFVNSGIYSIYVLTQFMSQSLSEHLRDAWSFGTVQRDHFISTVPAQMRLGESWYRGTADSIYQNMYLIKEHQPDLVAVFAGDHVYRMDVMQMVRYHNEREADVTVAVVPMPIEQASDFGVVVVDNYWRIVGFQEKPANPMHAPGTPDLALVSMGNYIFSRQALEEALSENAESPGTHHDFGHDILPRICAEKTVYAYDFRRNRVPGMATGMDNSYWRDVGTLDNYWSAHMDLRAVQPAFNLYNREWPIRTADYWHPPAKFVHEGGGRVGRAINSIVTDGCIISGGTVRGSVLGRNVHVHSYSELIDSVALDNVRIGRGARIRRTIIDQNVRIDPDVTIGFDLARDRERFHVTDAGIVVIAKGIHVKRDVPRAPVQPAPNPKR